MKQLFKAQLLIGILICFSLAWGLFQDLNAVYDTLFAVFYLLIQFAAFIVLSFIILAILEWLDLFDLKTNAILTYLTIVVIPLSLIL
jgi:hypothetical protein